MSQTPARHAPRWTWPLLLAAVAVSAVAVAVPVFTLHPFKPQTASGLELAYVLRRWSPVVSVAALLAACACAVLFVRSRRIVGGVVAVLLVGLAAGLAWFSFQNHFEWMFRPLHGPEFVAAADAAFVAAAEPVMSVAVGQDAAAFPVRQLAYHHIVQDTVGGVPVVVTY